MKQVIKKLTFLLIVLISVKISAQVDTTECYPLHVGDKWEYYHPWHHEYEQVEVIGDTLMPNGRTYFILTLYDRKYKRVKDSRYVMVYNEYADNKEYIGYDLYAKKGDVFKHNNKYGFGLYTTGIDYENILQENLEWKEYREVSFDTTVVPTDTIWAEGVDGYWPRITKGLGVSSYGYPISQLVGAIINGEEYGTLVDVKEPEELISDFKLYQNYPNPFNPNTTIKYKIPIVEMGQALSQRILLKVYDLLGREVVTLVNQDQLAGEYEVVFSGSNLSSGIYFIWLKAGNNCHTIKAQLLK